jgi:diguanylate cyclase (GGDEF)-like protein/PAS domain S-box-containing protein
MKLIGEYAAELLDAAPEAMIIVDARGTIVYANNLSLALFGYVHNELIGKQIEMLLPERYRAAHPELRVAYSRNPRLRPMSERQNLYAKHRNGTEFPVEIRLSSLQTNEGLLISSTIRQVAAHVNLAEMTTLLSQKEPAKTDQSGQTHEAIEARERAQATLNAIGDAVISTDRAGNVSYLNPVAEKMTGWLCDDAAGRPLQEVLTIINGSGREPVSSPLRLAMEKQEIVGATANGVLVRHDGAEFAIEDSTAPIHDDRGEIIGAVMVFRDVSSARAIAKKLAYAAQHDALTGLPNRLLLDSRLEQAIALARRHNQPAAVLFLDLDGFKQVNDTLSHAVGDRLLQSVARRLQQCVRSTDTVCRLGGDEFVVLLSEISRPADAVGCAEKILGSLREPHTVDPHSLRVTASIGIGIYPFDGTDPETLLRTADEAMFKAKRSGGSNYQLGSHASEYR